MTVRHACTFCRSSLAFRPWVTIRWRLYCVDCGVSVGIAIAEACAATGTRHRVEA